MTTPPSDPIVNATAMILDAESRSLQPVKLVQSRTNPIVQY